MQGPPDRDKVSVMRKPGYGRYGCVIGLCVLLMSLLSCESKDKYAGTYKALNQEAKSGGEIVLELAGTGDGVWRVGSDEVTFVWYVKRGELRLNTKGGGVIVGTIKEDTIQLTLPGPKTVIFKKTQ